MKWRFYFLTWLYSILFSTACIGLLVFGVGPSYLSFGERVVFVVEQLAYIGMLSFPFSMPGLLALILAPAATRHFADGKERFAVIILFCLLGTFAGYLLMWVALGYNPFGKSVLPGMGISFVAVLAALFINQRLFYKTFMPGYKRTPTIFNDTNNHKAGA